MDGSAGSDQVEKSWNHPWTTDEMRSKRDDWNLAGDSGLLNHLQQFSDKLASTVDKTRNALDSLTAELDDTIIFIDNITNTSLALANTQFIESRVSEDDVETESVLQVPPEEAKTKEQGEAEMIASIAESVRRGINIMDEKYETLEVDASDSEDEGEYQMPSIISWPKDPYRNRPLPYVIGTDRWKASSKIGIETSSSESEQQEEDSESESEDNQHEAPKQIPRENQRIARLSSSSSDSNDTDVTNDTRKANSMKQSDRIEDVDLESKSTTATNSLPKNGGTTAPNFAEELAKRLGRVAPTQKSVNAHQDEETIVISPKDDLFQREDDLFITPSKNLFSEDKPLFDDESSNSLWHDKPTSIFESSVIPSALDVPPPITAVSSKQKSALEDLFGDVDSEDSNDIFSPKPSVGKAVHNNNSLPERSTLVKNNRVITIGATDKATATSTPENHDADKPLFDDESEDMDDLFGVKKSRNDWTGANESIFNRTASSTPAEATGNINRKQLRHLPPSDSSTSNSSSDSETSRTGASARRNDASPVINNSLVNEGLNVLRNMDSGISDQRQSIDITGESNISHDFQPRMSSTRNRSQDTFRERIVSDSLFVANTLQRNSANSLNNVRIDHVAGAEDSDLFDPIDDSFGPPPLPTSGSKTDSKSKVNSSLFDDSDTSDDLFSNMTTTPAVRKTSDISATTSNNPREKSKTFETKGLFDDEGDIFGSTDSPESNVFAGLSSEKRTESSDSEITARSIGKISSTKQERVNEETSKNIFGTENVPRIPKPASTRHLDSIFDDLGDDDDDDDDDDLFGPSLKKKSSNDEKAPSLFDNTGDDLFSAPIKPLNKPEVEPAEPIMNEPEDPVISPKKSLKSEKPNSELMQQLTAKLKSTRTEEKSITASETKSKTATKKVDKVKIDSVFEDVDENELFSSVKRASSDKLATGEIEKTIAKMTEKSDAIAKTPKKLELPRKTGNTKELKKSLQKDVEAKVLGETTRTIQETRIVSEETTTQSIESVSKKVSSSEEEFSSNLSASEETSAATRREPPKTLEIRSTSSTVSSDKTSVVQRRVVSGKIKNLMGRMSDLKILSPTDTPPVLRKNDEKMEDDEDKDSEDGSCLSTSKESPTLSEELSKPPAIPSPTERKQLERAISFDDPVQVETLSVIASKSRARIQSKRRPQSRRARQNALRHSGIDFDTVDFSNDNDSDSNRNVLSNSTNNNPASMENSVNVRNTTSSTTDRLVISGDGVESVSVKATESSTSTVQDDRSEMSFSKESSLSVNKTTLLSPSTDEEDLFDVPPDLPEDPPKEDSLFGRAPILSPVQSFVKVQKNAKHESHRSEHRKGSSKSQASSVVGSFSQVSSKQSTLTEESVESETRQVFGKAMTLKTTAIGKQFDSETSEETVSTSSKKDTGRSIKEQTLQDRATKDRETKVAETKDRKGVSVPRENVEDELNDPLRDDTFDPLQDPSHLFAFVKKTPSPVKGKNLLFNEDADEDLFSSKSNKTPGDGKQTREEANKSLVDASKKLDLFADETEGDLFSTVLPKTALITRKEKKIDLFGDDSDADDDGEALFGGFSKKSDTKSNVKQKRSVQSSKTVETSVKQKSSSLFDDVPFPTASKIEEKSETPAKNTKRTIDVFSEHESSDIFATSTKSTSSTTTSGTTNSSKVPIKDIFGDDSSDEGDIFALKKNIVKNSTVPSNLFDSADDDGTDIFGNSTTPTVARSKTTERRGTAKKVATRDLKKTAEKIVEDPLSMLQRD